MEYFMIQCRYNLLFLKFKYHWKIKYVPIIVKSTEMHPVCYELWLRFLIFFLCLFPCFVYLFSILCIPRFYIVLCVVYSFAYSCFFPIFVQVYRPLPPDGNSFAGNKYHNINVNQNSLKNCTNVGIASNHVIDMDNFFLRFCILRNVTLWHSAVQHKAIAF
jgi:hypothetical protein